MISAFGQPGVPAERAARQAVAQARHRLQSRVPVGPELADQLLGPLALAAGGTFRTVEPTTHFTTNAHILQSFVDAPIRCSVQPDGARIVTIGTSHHHRADAPG